MSVILIYNVFRYFCRDELEIISNTSRFIQRLIEHKFPAHPFRVFDQLSICANEGDDLKLRLMNGYALLLQDHSNIEEFKERISHSEELDDSTCLQVDEMQPFLGLNVRIKETIIWLLPRSSITPQHISAIEKISHLWTDRRLQLNSFSGQENSQTIGSDCALIFKSPDIIKKCHQLSIWGIDMPFSDFPNLYKPKAIKFIRFVTSQISPSHLLDFIKGIAENKTIVFFELADNFVETHIAKIRVVSLLYILLYFIVCLRECMCCS
ncbi:hypothetical protein Ddc_16016 [Ditylenchus destructor]|nr:hypothetical protein Ddc_16016 [Ditylenchus destructor]